MPTQQAVGAGVSGEKEGPETGLSNVSPLGAGVEPVAAALALGGASREEADAFLRDQRKLIALQAQELTHELDLRHWSLWVRHASGVLRLTLELGIGLVMLALVGGIGLTVRNAAHADGLVIESFAVPPELAVKGLTGQVVASHILDHLTRLQNETKSNRAPQSFANNWGDDIKVEIPDTGISFGEAYRYLKGWLGNETHVRGEVVRTDNGISITTRVGGGDSASFAGAEADIGTLVQKAAEDIYGRTQPYRYAIYVGEHGRPDEALRIFEHLSEAGSPADRPWGYIARAVNAGDPDSFETMVERAVALQPDNMDFLVARSMKEAARSRPEQALNYIRQSHAISDRASSRYIRPEVLVALRQLTEAQAAGLTGDYAQAANLADQSQQSASLATFRPSLWLWRYRIGSHDHAAARALSIDSTGAYWGSSAFPALWDTPTQMAMDQDAQDWARILIRANDLAALYQKQPESRLWSVTMTVPFIAYARAQLGDIARAEVEIGQSAADCYDCLIARARIAELKGEPGRADYWFAKAVHEAPSIPFAHETWGRSLLARGKTDAAIDQFRLSIQKGPHFADALEGWGAALIAKNQSHLALEKFAEAEKYAPNWGRLHLKWGQALAYSGNREEARKQFARAAALNLTPSEKSELARVNHV
jgi:tetratricopeptide (TPR) repeat protein